RMHGHDATRSFWVRGASASTSHDIAQSDLDEGSMQSHRERRQFSNRLLGPGARLRSALPGHGSHDLREQADLPFSRTAKGPQMTSLEPVPGHLDHDLADGESVVVIAAAGPGGDQPELLELPQLISG